MEMELTPCKSAKCAIANLHRYVSIEAFWLDCFPQSKANSQKSHIQMSHTTSHTCVTSDRPTGPTHRPSLQACLQPSGISRHTHS